MLINIQFLRVLAAMLVVFYHTSAHLRSTGAGPGMFFQINDAVGFAGVDIFFVISGFIMAHTSLAASGQASGWAFLRRRIARIYSGYWPFFLLAIPLFHWVNPILMQDMNLLKNLFLWPVYPLLVAVAWTLIFEMFFYLLFTVIISLTGQRRLVLLYGLFVAMVIWSVYSQFVRTAYAPGHLEYMSMAEYYMLSPYLLEFLGGAIAAYWLQKPARIVNVNAAFLLLALGIAMFLTGGWINLNYFGGSLEEGYSVFYRVLVFGTPAVVILMASTRLDQAGLRAPARCSLLAGGASYAIYLSHTLILLAVQKLGFNEFASGWGGAVTQVIYLLLTLAILAYSIAHYRWVERPLHGWFKRILRLGVLPRHVVLPGTQTRV